MKINKKRKHIFTYLFNDSLAIKHRVKCLRTQVQNWQDIRGGIKRNMTWSSRLQVINFSSPIYTADLSKTSSRNPLQLQIVVHLIPPQNIVRKFELGPLDTQPLVCN